MENVPYTYQDLAKSVRKTYYDAKRWRTEFAITDQFLQISKGSIFGRSWDQYLTLFHETSVQKLEEILRTNNTTPINVLDIGGGAGYALMDLINLYPHIQAQLSDIRNTPMNIDSGTKERLHTLHEYSGVVFDQNDHLELFRNPELRNKFHIITSVFSAYSDISANSDTNDGPLWPYFLKRLPRLLAPGGMAIVFNGISPRLHRATMECLDNWNIPFVFYEAKNFEPDQSQLGNIFGTTIVYASNNHSTS